jgi:hypothetical protein
MRTLNVAVRTTAERNRSFADLPRSQRGIVKDWAGPVVAIIAVIAGLILSLHVLADTRRARHEVRQAALEDRKTDYEREKYDLAYMGLCAPWRRCKSACSTPRRRKSKICGTLTRP